MARRQTQTLHPLLHLPPLLFFFSTFPPSCTSSGGSPVSTPAVHPRALVAPITKDPLANLYTIPLDGRGHPFLLDIGGPLLWSACAAGHPTVPCNTRSCALAHAFPSPVICPRVMRARSRPCACRATPVNPVTRKCTVADLTLTDVTVSATHGRNPTGLVTIPGVTSSCASPKLLKSLPAGAIGVAGLPLPSQLASKLSFRRQFAICLPSTGSTPGVAFFGSNPFYLLPPPGVDVTARLSYTNLKKNRKSPGYYLALKGIAVNGENVEFLERLLEFDSLGHGGVKLSTVTPYTTLHGHIYRPFLKAYARATRGIPRARKVAPFDLCLQAGALGSTRVGYGVPQVDLMLEGGRNWTVFGANSFKQVDDGTACLAFVNGGGPGRSRRRWWGRSRWRTTCCSSTSASPGWGSAAPCGGSAPPVLTSTSRLRSEHDLSVQDPCNPQSSHVV